MSQDAATTRSRAISTAKFLMTSQSCNPGAKEKRREIWDAANRQVITLTESPIHYDEPDLCSPSSLGPSKPSLLDIITGKPGRVDSPVSPDSSTSPTSLRSPGSSKNIRSSLTGYQWGGGSPTAASAAAAVDSSGPSSRTSPEYNPLLIPDPCRSKSLDMQRQQAAAVADEQPGISKSMGRRRHSVQLPATAEHFSKLQEPPGSPSRITADTADAEQARPPKLLNGKSRRGSLLGYPTTAAAAEAADADALNHHLAGLSFKAPRRSRSLEVTGTLLDGSISPAAASPTAAAARSPMSGSPKNSSRRLQLCTASALSSVGAADATTEAVVSPSPAARGAAAAMLKGSSQASLASNRPASGAVHTSIQVMDKDSVDGHGGLGFKPLVPSIELIDQRALEHPAESDCTPYNVLLASSMRH